MTDIPTFIPGESYGKVECERGWKWNRGDIPFQDYDLWYVWRGEGQLNLNGVNHSLAHNQCYLFRPGDLVDAWHNPHQPLVVTYIHFEASEGSAWLDSLPSRCDIASPLAFEAYLDRFVHLMTFKEHRHVEEASILLHLLMIGFEREIMSGGEDSSSRQNPHFEAVMKIAAAIRENPAKSGTIAELAKRAFLSPRYFSLKFREVMGQTIESYIIEKKIERAELLLSHHGMTVGEVAEALNYQNIYYFSKQFKKVRGYSPSRAAKPLVTAPSRDN
ncbi:AraC family transcriptional regulator [Paenibacillus sp. HB172176]|uniref:helix-turn-helix domain-containing protein n=1 Tax=Paenibacillus sp. HB172176 TaxID=2493690 RepID=UPI00143A682F|nr:AraC family transcriptional regulator [Paenibacillus sp. HB172176]